MRAKFIILGASALFAAGCGSALAQPRGSYLATCTQVIQRGPLLQAYCRNAYGGFALSRLDLRACGGGDIANINGRLVCSGGRIYSQPGYGPRPGFGPPDHGPGRGYGRPGHEPRPAPGYGRGGRAYEEDYEPRRGRGYGPY